MFAFTIPLGWLADRLGRERVMYPGVGVAVVGALLVALSASVYFVTVGTFLVGLGWAAANVSATALIADQVQTQERGRAIGVNETASGMTALAMALVTGPLVEYGGLPATGLVAACVAVVPFALWGFERTRARIEAASLRN
jgi:MFS family permease